MRIKIIFILFLLSVSVSAQEKKHPIDAAQDICLKKEHSTRGTAQCLSKAFEAWDADITKTYAELEKEISPDLKQYLENSQTSWETYRDAEFDFIGSLYGKQRGTMYIPIRLIERIEILKARALVLENHLFRVRRLNGKD